MYGAIHILGTSFCRNKIEKNTLWRTYQRTEEIRSITIIIVAGLEIILHHVTTPFSSKELFRTLHNILRSFMILRLIHSSMNCASNLPFHKMPLNTLYMWDACPAWPLKGSWQRSRR